ncbi:hypothetical protein N8719_03645, partial [Flavobacteriaceae bacterium]|nr:hypothetical protein [Flavobacteriaceae bacterium]
AKLVYITPLCILPLILKAFFDARLGLFVHVLTILLLGFTVPSSFEFLFLQTIAGMVTILTVSELYKRANLFISVAQITFVYILGYFAFFIIQEGNVELIQWDYFMYFILCGLLTLFSFPLIYIYEKMFGLVSDVSLLELSDTNSKLLKELSNKAPGTFHHSLNVANLAEAAANEIGANAMFLMSEEKALELGLTPLATIRSYADAAQDPKRFTTSPAKALPIALEKAALKIDDIDYFELNEAFAVVGLANMKLLGVDNSIVNVNGGAVSLGHPLGCSGVRILITLINVLKQNKSSLGAAAICNGGGGASAMILERN